MVSKILIHTNKHIIGLGLKQNFKSRKIIATSKLLRITFSANLLLMSYDTILFGLSLSSTCPYFTFRFLQANIETSVGPLCKIVILYITVLKRLNVDETHFSSSIVFNQSYMYIMYIKRFFLLAAQLLFSSICVNISPSDGY